jgi:predicted methyltransferase
MKIIQLYRGSVVFDIDGVLADFEGAFCQTFGEYNRHLYGLEQRFPENLSKSIQNFVESPESYTDLSPIFGGIVTLNQFKQRGYHILIVTGRDKSLRGVTRKWLSRYNVHYNDLYFSNNKLESIKDFQHVRSNLKVQYIIDDSVEVLDTVSDGLGIPALAWEQEWNKHYTPRIRYDQELMKVVGTKDGTNWYPIWEKVGKDE